MNHTLPQLLPHCGMPAGQFCGSCRDREGGRVFRRGALDRHGMHEVGSDFVCPLGKPWGDDRPAQPVPPRDPWYKPGSVLKVAIRLVTGDEPSAGCGCDGRARQMNAWGWWGSWRRRQTIAGWLVEEARTRGHELDQAGALPMLVAAWREVRSRRRR
ncbi:MAG: hypothetical protein AAGI68_14215 [Planctomycetota bacterium]